MSKYAINDTTLTAIGDAIREKEGSTEPIMVSDFANRIAAISGGGGDEEVVFPGSVNNPYSKWNENWMPQLQYADFYEYPRTNSSNPHVMGYFLLEFEPDAFDSNNSVKVDYHKATTNSVTVYGKFFTFDGTDKTLVKEVTASNGNYLNSTTLTKEDMYLTPEGKYQIYFYAPQRYLNNRDIMQLAYGFNNYNYTIRALIYLYSSLPSSLSEVYSPLLYKGTIYTIPPCIDFILFYGINNSASTRMFQTYVSSSSNDLGRNPQATYWARCKGFELRNNDNSIQNTSIFYQGDSDRKYGMLIENDIFTIKLDKVNSSNFINNGNYEYRMAYTLDGKKMINFEGVTEKSLYSYNSSLYYPVCYKLFVDFSNFVYSSTSSTFNLYVKNAQGTTPWKYVVESLATLNLPTTVTTKNMYVDRYNYYKLINSYPELAVKITDELGYTLNVS